MVRVAVVKAIDPDNFAVEIQYRDNSERQRGVKIAGRIYQNLQIGDVVIVAYADGSPADPIILDKVLVPGDPLLGDERPEPDDIKMLHEVKNSDGEVTGKIVMQTDKDGKLTIEVSGILGEINLIAKGNQGDVKVFSAGATVITSMGGTTVNSTGAVNVNSESDVNVVAAGNVDIEAGTGNTIEIGDNLAKQIANNFPVCLFTGAPHAVGNTQVKV